MGIFVCNAQTHYASRLCAYNTYICASIANAHYYEVHLCIFVGNSLYLITSIVTLTLLLLQNNYQRRHLKNIQKAMSQYGIFIGIKIYLIFVFVAEFLGNILTFPAPPTGLIGYKTRPSGACLHRIHFVHKFQ